MLRESSLKTSAWVFASDDGWQRKDGPEMAGGRFGACASVTEIDSISNQATVAVVGGQGPSPANVEVRLSKLLACRALTCVMRVCWAGFAKEPSSTYLNLPP